jgi:hypothetical protein
MQSSRDKNVAAAVEGYRSGKYTSLRSAAADFDLPESTVRGRYHGQPSRLDAHNKERILTDDQEEDLVRRIIELDEQHRAPTKLRLRSMVGHILREEGVYRQVGRQWVDRFVRRHPAVAKLLGKSQEADRINQASEANVRAWFQHLDCQMKKYKIQRQNLYNMDEHGQGLGICSEQTVVGSSTNKSTGKKRKRTRTKASQDREWVSIVECISGSFTVMKPLVIFKGENVMLNNFPENPPIYYYTAQKSGWTDDEIGVYWLSQVFIPCTQPDKKSTYRLLILDGHKSHVSHLFEEIAERNKIILCTLPAHTSDVLQPLDLAAFSPLTTRYETELYELQQFSDASPIKRKDFLVLYDKARKETIREKVIRNCWKEADIIPWNPDMVCQKEEVQNLETNITPPPISQAIGTPQHPRDTTWCIDWIENQEEPIEAKYELMKLICQKSQKAHELAMVELAHRSDTIAQKNRHIIQMINEKPRQRVLRAKERGLIDQIDVLRQQEDHYTGILRERQNEERIANSVRGRMKK